eukprot:4443673-Karenia_brevis.AAC.1
MGSGHAHARAIQPAATETPEKHVDPNRANTMPLTEQQKAAQAQERRKSLQAQKAEALQAAPEEQHHALYEATDLAKHYGSPSAPEPRMDVDSSH